MNEIREDGHEIEMSDATQSESMHGEHANKSTKRDPRKSSPCVRKWQYTDN